MVQMLYNDNMRKDKYGKPITQIWLTVEAKKAALIASYHAELDVQQWISAAIIEQAKQEMEEGQWQRLN